MLVKPPIPFRRFLDDPGVSKIYNNAVSWPNLAFTRLFHLARILPAQPATVASFAAVRGAGRKAGQR